MGGDKQTDALVLIGGASGVGKTTLARALEKQGLAVYKKVHDLAIDIAREMGTDIKTAIEQMDDLVLIEKLISLAREYHSIVSDLHFAIQPRTDTIILAGRRVEDEKLLATEEYVPAFKVADLGMVISCGITLVPILITYDTSNLIRIRFQDTTRAPRSLERTIVQRECAAELETYLAITRQLGLEEHVFVNIDGQFDKLKDEVVSLLVSKTKR